MNSHPKSIRSFRNLEVARKRFPKGKGPQRILVLNNQGLPIMQMSNLDEFDFLIDDQECAEIVDLARVVYSGIKAFRGREPLRIAFFFNDEVITIERDGPFILLMNWSETAFRSNPGSEAYIRRLEGTLFRGAKLMKNEWMIRIASIYGVDCSIIVDRDGLVIAQAGKASDRIAPHSAMMVRQLMDKIGVSAIDDWGWTQCETEEVIIAISFVYVGILVVVMRSDANLTKVRIEAENLRKTLKKEFIGPFVT